MARATRSSTHHQEKEKEKDKEKERNTDTTTSSAVPRTKPSSKKRKRGSFADSDDQPAVKQLRPDSAPKAEGSPESDPFLSKDPNLPLLQNAGDVPIDLADARKILDVLEMIDNQGLLDRVFPLPAQSPGSRPASLSFRSLLKDSSQHPLSVLRSAVRHLLPISSHPRSRSSTPAAQQLQFCNLALSLLAQASFNAVPIPLDVETILPPPPEPLSDGAANVPNGDSKTPHMDPSPSPIKKRRYALMQRLSNGEWWTSLNSDNSLSSPGGRELKDLHTAHAEFVVIMQALSAVIHNDDTFPGSAIGVPTVGSLTTQKTSLPNSKVLGPRRVNCGTFLDYGPYASFAPTFDQDGAEVGRRVLGEVVWNTEEKRRKRRIKKSDVQVPIVAVSEPVDVSMDDDVQECPQNEWSLKKDIEGSLDGLLPADQIASFLSSLDCLELEYAVHELLQRNSLALKRLAELQRLRLSGENGGSSQAKEGSEEWDTAQEIVKSLSILASLRPRTSGDTSETAPLIPHASVLRRLYATLPLAHTRGWRGTISTQRTSALRDDTTMRIRSGATIPASTPAATTTSTPAAGATSTTPSVPVYPGYPYSNYATSQYRPGYTPYKPGQTPTYYPTTYTPHAPGQAQAGSQTYYANQSYSAAGQQAYSYGPWYSYQPPSAANAGTSSGRGTPQPATTTAGAAGANPSSSLATNYAGFFNNANQTTAQRAVANTVVGSKPIGTSYAANASGYIAPTLPPYLRGTAGSASSQPGAMATTGGYQTNYYGTYPQVASSAAE